MISFKGKHFLNPIILMAVRWYLAYSLSYRDIEELLLERGLRVDHATVNRWVIEYSPQLEAAFKASRKPVKNSWRMDETYVKIKGQWMYQYRAVDRGCDTIDFYFAKNRDKKAVLCLLKKAIGYAGKPTVVNVDKSGANTAALVEVNKTLTEAGQIDIRQNKYLNNMIEQGNRFIKKITRPMLGFKSTPSARATLDGIELHHMLRKAQHINAKNKSIIEQFYALAA